MSSSSISSGFSVFFSVYIRPDPHPQQLQRSQEATARIANDKELGGFAFVMSTRELADESASAEGSLTPIKSFSTSYSNTGTLSELD